MTLNIQARKTKTRYPHMYSWSFLQWYLLWHFISGKNLRNVASLIIWLPSSVGPKSNQAKFPLPLGDGASALEIGVQWPSCLQSLNSDDIISVLVKICKERHHDGRPITHELLTGALCHSSFYFPWSGDQWSHFTRVPCYGIIWSVTGADPIAAIRFCPCVWSLRHTRVIYTLITTTWTSAAILKPGMTLVWCIVMVITANLVAFI